jgi:hypothetical protein
MVGVSSCGCGGNCDCPECQQTNGVSGVGGLTVSTSGIVGWGAGGAAVGYLYGGTVKSTLIGAACGAVVSVIIDNIGQLSS